MGNSWVMFGAGKTIYSMFTKDTKTGKERLNPSLSKEIRNSLGESAEKKFSRKSRYHPRTTPKIGRSQKTTKTGRDTRCRKGKNKHKTCKIWDSKLKKRKRGLMPFKKNLAAILKVNQKELSNQT